MTKAVDDLRQGLSTDDFNTVMSTINSIDWSDASQWENLPEIFRQMGINVPTGALQNLIDTAIETTGAIKKIDLELLNEKLISVQQTIQAILSGEQQFNNFSEEFVEDIKALDSTFGDKFLQRLDGTYTYIGGTMEDLISAINENTSAQLNKAVDQFNTKLSMVDLMKDMDQVGTIKGNVTGKDVSSMITNKETWDQEHKRGYLDTFAKTAKDRNIDLASLGIPGLTADTDFSSLDDTTVDNIVNQLYNMYQEGADGINAEISKTYRDSFTKTF
jgi:hypothetical protein